MRLFKVLVVFNLLYFPALCENQFNLNLTGRGLKNLAEAVIKLINPKNENYAETINIISPEVVENFYIADFKDELLSKIFPKNVFIRLKKVSSLRLKRRKRNLLIAVSDLKEFLDIYKGLSREFFRLSGFYVVALLQGEISEIQEIFKLMWNRQIYNVILMYDDEVSVKLKTFMPFNPSKCNDTTPVTINEFRNGKFVNKTLNFPPKMKNLYNCPIRFSVSNSTEPFTFEIENLSFEKNLYGPDTELIRVLSETLSFEAVYTYIGHEGYLYANGTASGPWKTLIDGDADMTLTSWWLKPNRLNYFDASSSYKSDKIIFLVNSGAYFTTFEKLTLSFSAPVWLLIAACFILGIISIFIIRLGSVEIQAFVFGTSVQTPYLNLFIGFIGGTQNILPKNNFARFLLMSFLMYSLVIRTLYQGTYFKLMQSSRQHKEVQSINEMISEDFRFFILPWMADLFVGFDDLEKRYFKSLLKLKENTSNTHAF